MDYMDYPPSSDPMAERERRPWNNNPNNPQLHTHQTHSSQPMINPYSGHGSLTPLSSASRVPPEGLRGPETPFPFFHSNRGSAQGLQSHVPMFQRANRMVEMSEPFPETFPLPSSPYVPSQIPDTYPPPSQCYSVHEEQTESGPKSETKTSLSQSLPSSQGGPKRVPVFKAARGKGTTNKGKKRPMEPGQNPEECPPKKHTSVPSFMHSEASAFKQVSKKKNKDTTATPDQPIMSPAKTEVPENGPKESQAKSQPKKQPLRPKFKTHQGPKKIKTEDTDGSGVSNADRRKDGSSKAPLNKPKKGNKTTLHKSQPKPPSNPPLTVRNIPNPPSVPVKEESMEEDPLDVTGISDIENEDLEVMNFLAPSQSTQCPAVEKKKKKVVSKKKLLPNDPTKKMSKTRLEDSDRMNKDEDQKMDSNQSLNAVKKRVLKAPMNKKNMVVEGKKGSSQAFTSGVKKNKVLGDPMSKPKKKFTKKAFAASLSQQTTTTTKPRIPLREKTYNGSTTDDSNLQISVDDYKDKAENITQTSPSQHTSDRSQDLDSMTLSSPGSPSPPPPRQTTVHNQKNSAVNKDKILTQENKNTCRKETTTTTTTAVDPDEEIIIGIPDSVKKSVVQLMDALDEDDVWVQCDQCLKWRKLSGLVDPATLPDKWYCTMMSVPGKNNCQEPQEEWEETNSKYIYYEHQFVIGSVVWAQVPGCLWWPGIVDIDPDYHRYDWFNSTWSNPTFYHVTFFGEPVTRAWVMLRNIQVFKQGDTVKKFSVDTKELPRDPLLKKAVQEASYALTMEVRRRRMTYAFVNRYTGRINESPINKYSGMRASTPMKKSFGHKKQLYKQAKGLHAVPPVTGRSATMKKKQPHKDTQSASQLKDITKYTNRKETNSEMGGKEQDSYEEARLKAMSKDNNRQDEGRGSDTNREETRAEIGRKDQDSDTDIDEGMKETSEENYPSQDKAQESGANSQSVNSEGNETMDTKDCNLDDQTEQGNDTECPATDSTDRDFYSQTDGNTVSSSWIGGLYETTERMRDNIETSQKYPSAEDKLKNKCTDGTEYNTSSIPNSGQGMRTNAKVAEEQNYAVNEDIKSSNDASKKEQVNSTSGSQDTCNSKSTDEKLPEMNEDDVSEGNNESESNVSVEDGSNGQDESGGSEIEGEEYESDEDDDGSYSTDANIDGESDIEDEQEDSESGRIDDLRGQDESCEPENCYTNDDSKQEYNELRALEEDLRGDNDEDLEARKSDDDVDDDDDEVTKVQKMQVIQDDDDDSKQQNDDDEYDEQDTNSECDDESNDDKRNEEFSWDFADDDDSEDEDNEGSKNTDSGGREYEEQDSSEHE